MRNLVPVFEHIKAVHGEGPVWDPESQRLYWVDISGGKFFCGDPVKQSVDTFDTGQPIGVLALCNDQRVIMGLRDGIGIFNKRDRQLDIFFRLPDGKDLRFNDGTVDPQGRFVAGTMNMNGDASVGKLYSVDEQKKVTIFKDELYIPNGMKWSANKKTFFLTDTPKHVIYAFDYEVETGKIYNQRHFIDFPSSESPDGMCIDDEGSFWVALWGAGKMLRFDKNGKRIEEISMPVPYATSCCFGGEKRNQLFITSSARDLDENQRKQYPLSGCTFMMETEVTGPAQGRFAG